MNDKEFIIIFVFFYFIGILSFILILYSEVLYLLFMRLYINHLISEEFKLNNKIKFYKNPYYILDKNSNLNGNIFDIISELYINVDEEYLEPIFQNNEIFQYKKLEIRDINYIRMSPLQSENLYILKFGSTFCYIMYFSSFNECLKKEK